MFPTAELCVNWQMGDLVNHGLRVPSFNANRRNPFGRQRMIEPCRQWTCLEDNELRVQSVLADDLR
jgi:hypothetical protein